jgi:fructose transport system substrate-binding protein
MALGVALALTGAGVAACGGGSSSGGSSGKGNITIGLITKTDTNPFFVKMKAGAKKAAAKDGVKLMTAAGKYDGDNASQVTAINNMVAAGAKGILLVPSNTTAIVPVVQKARNQGVKVITLDTPLQPQNAADALFATNNFTAGKLIGEYAKKAMAGKTPVIAMMDLNPGITVGDLRHNGFLSGFGIPKNSKEIVCSQYTQGDQAKGQTAMENCLQKNPNINLVYSINEPSGLGAWNALHKAGKTALLVSVDGGCTGVKAVQQGKIAATSQQYPLKMASEGVQAIVDSVNNKGKVSGYHDTGVNLITGKPMSGVDSKDVKFGLANCWG